MARIQDFRMGGVEVPQAPRRVRCGEGRGYPFPQWGKADLSPQWGKVWGNFRIFLLKIPYFGGILTRLFLK